jgi:membrane-associated phospholipid phosphatase
VTVGLVKHLLGRLGPLQLGHGALAPGGSEIFTDGTFFPSGHTANAVITWGVLAILARSHRRWAAALAVLLSITVGLTTVYLGTHWVPDVLAGWVASGLVLLAVHLCRPAIERTQRWPTRSRRTLPGRLRPEAWMPTTALTVGVDQERRQRRGGGRPEVSQAVVVAASARSRP